MDALGRDTYRNATESLTSIDQLIAAKISQIAATEKKYQTARDNFNYCTEQKEGFFSIFNCSKNTGRTVGSWEDEMNYQANLLKTYKADKVALDGRRSILVQQMKTGGEAEAIQDIASQEKSKKIINWLIIAGIISAGLFAGYLMFKKLKK